MNKSADAVAALAAMGIATPTFQTISEKTEAHDGRLRMEPAERLETRQGRKLQGDLRESAA
jgi:hypothetical protein